MVAGASVRFRRWGPDFVYRHLHVLFFLRLRSALGACGVPWSASVSSRPMRDWIAPSAGRPSVSLIYDKVLDCIAKPLSVEAVWSGELSDLDLSVDWEGVWSSLGLASGNLARRLVHFGSFVERAWLLAGDLKWSCSQVLAAMCVALHHRALFCVCFGSVLSSSVCGRMWTWFCHRC